MSSRRNGSVSRAAETASKTRLHMDRNPQHSRITDPSNPAGRRKELDNVMKRARQASPGSWDRKLLEVEEKDPNRWRHTGYKQMYLEDSGSVSPRRSRSPVPGGRSRSPPPLGRRSRSPVARRVRSPPLRRELRKSRSRSPRRSPRRSPIRRGPSPLNRRRSPRARSPMVRPRSPLSRARSPLSRARSPLPRARSPMVRVRSPVARARSPVPRRSPVPARRVTPPPRSRAMAVRPRPPSPPPRQSSSGSSGSSCSDDSCSVCSAKNKKQPPPPPPKGAKIPPRLKSKSPTRARPPPPGPRGEARAVQPTRELLKAREGSKRTREEKVLEWQRGQLIGAAGRSGPVPIPPEQIKREGERAPPPTDPRTRPHPPPHPRVSPGAIAAALTRHSESDSETGSSDQAPQRLTLSERFGKMAQWSIDRSARMGNMNMRITRRDAQLHVRIDAEPAPDPARHPTLLEMEAPAGSYPEELLAAAPGGLPSWDDVTVRYDYYKKKGYLRGLTLGDYVKWEEWWYKYQEWLERERAYERWADGEGRPRRDGRRRKGGGRHRRS